MDLIISNTEAYSVLYTFQELGFCVYVSECKGTFPYCTTEKRLNHKNKRSMPHYVSVLKVKGYIIKEEQNRLLIGAST